MLCDFCNTADVRWMYKAKCGIITLPDGTRFGSDGGWGACDTCHKFIETEDTNNLLDHSVTLLLSSNPDLCISKDIASEIITFMHNFFRQARVGSPTELVTC